MILILSRGRSESTTEEIEWINYLDGECIRINGDELKKATKKISFEISNPKDTDNFKFIYNNKFINLNEINIVWNRTYKKGCGTVARVMQNQFSDRFALGIIDKDKRVLNYLTEF